MHEQIRSPDSPNSAGSLSGQPGELFGFNVISYVSGNLGIGVTARNIVDLLLKKGLPVAIYDIDPGLGRGKHDMRFAKYAVDSVEELPYAINLLVLPPADLPWALLDFCAPLVMKRNRLNVAFSMWELTVLPERWKEALQFFDILVAESDFIRYAFDFNLSRVLSLTARHPIYFPDDVQSGRQRFGLPENDVIFISSFDPLSDPQRKNPFAVLEAFQRGVTTASRARLVFKMNNAVVDGKMHPTVRFLKDRCNDDPRIILITETLSYSEVLSLYASCDVFVSLHRAEGLGLGLMEAMALGKPVLATAWSGNMSFMDHTNSCLVGYELIPAQGSISEYKKELAGLNAMWADPDVDEAAAWMKKLVDEPQLRATIGNKAADDMAAFHGEAERAHFLDEIQAIWEHQAFLSTVGRDRRGQLRMLRDTYFKYSTSYAKQLKMKAQQALDRHLLWRFKTRL